MKKRYFYVVFVVNTRVTGGFDVRHKSILLEPQDNYPSLIKITSDITKFYNLGAISSVDAITVINIMELKNRLDYEHFKGAISV